MKVLMIAAAVAALATGAVAAETKVTASNGVKVSVNADQFAARTAYTSPKAIFQAEGEKIQDSEAFAAKVRNADDMSALTIQGRIRYANRWRYYRNAVFKGGDPAPVEITGRDVATCMTSTCIFNERFVIDITPEQIAKYAEGGNLSVQFRSETGQVAVMTIPVSYLEAVQEVAR
ncbi:hypothetical protein [Caulobacter sp. UC70_42]|uniref:hypothetical protein n=1 Tax=Caulobacter sp. UC70_42 TaxID=3374551 RepID=UPI003756A0BF